MERLADEYRGRIWDQKVTIRVIEQRRTAREEEAMAMEMARMRAETEQLESEDAERIETERRYEAEETESMEAERQAIVEAVHVSLERQDDTEEACMYDIIEVGGKPPQRGQHGSNRKGDKRQKRQISTKRRGGENGEFVQVVRK